MHFDPLNDAKPDAYVFESRQSLRKPVVTGIVCRGDTDDTYHICKVRGGLAPRAEMQQEGGKRVGFVYVRPRCEPRGMKPFLYRAHGKNELKVVQNEGAPLSEIAFGLFEPVRLEGGLEFCIRVAGPLELEEIRARIATRRLQRQG